MLAFNKNDMLITSPNLIEPKEFILFFEDGQSGGNRRRRTNQ